MSSPPVRRCSFARAARIALVTAAWPASMGNGADVTIRAVPDQMRYDVTEFRVFAGEPVRLVFRNDDFMPHNLVVCRPRSSVTPGAEEDNGLEVAVAAWSLGERATALNWIPAHPRVLVSTRILEAYQSDAVAFTAPEQPGRYPYVCTFPGHALSMFGAMQVQARMEGLRGLRYRVYGGPFSEFPDFSGLRARRVAEGTLPDGLIDAAVGGARESFAVQFEGVLPIPRDGEYTFTVAGDNGPVLLLDDRVVIDHRAGKSWEQSASQTVILARGERRLVLRYWHRRERRKLHPEVTLLWSARDFKELPLSRVDLVARRRQQDTEKAIGIPLGPEDGEPAFYRNFLAGVMPSGFGIGYPGGVNLTWDPVRMNVGSLWAGAFLDIKRHRTLRGGVVKPAGFAVVAPAPGQPFAILPDPASPWPEPAAPDERGGFRFLGYSLDEYRLPTFRYQFGGVTVADTFVPQGSLATADLRLTRTLVLVASGTPPPHLMFRVLRSADIEPQGDGFLFQKRVRVTTTSPGILRPAAAEKEVLLPVAFHEGLARIAITYAWEQHLH